MSSRWSSASKLLLCCALTALCAATVASGDIWTVPVTYFDFHSDGSNPEFEVIPFITGGSPNTIQLVADSLPDANLQDGPAQRE